jgi:hypothetical protein
MFLNLKRKLGEKWYKLYCKPNVVGMTRIQMGFFDKSITFNDLSPEEKRRYCERALELERDEVLNHIFNETVEQVIADTFKNVPEENMRMCRWNIDGISKIKETLRSYASMVPKDQDDFDKHEVI